MSEELNLLRQTGEALYGPQWQAALARDLKVSDRAVRRWIAGEARLPDGVWFELFKLTKQHMDELHHIHVAIREIWGRL